MDHGGIVMKLWIDYGKRYYKTGKYKGMRPESRNLWETMFNIIFHEILFNDALVCSQSIVDAASDRNEET